MKTKQRSINNFSNQTGKSVFGLIVTMALFALLSSPAHAGRIQLPADPAVPTNNATCDQLYEAYMAIRDQILAESKKLGAIADRIISQGGGYNKYNPYFQKVSVLSDKASNILHQGSEARRHCYNKVRGHNTRQEAKRRNEQQQLRQSKIRIQQFKQQQEKQQQDWSKARNDFDKFLKDRDKKTEASIAADINVFKAMKDQYDNFTSRVEVGRDIYEAMTGTGPKDMHSQYDRVMGNVGKLAGSNPGATALGNAYNPLASRIFENSMERVGEIHHATIDVFLEVEKQVNEQFKIGGSTLYAPSTYIPGSGSTYSEEPSVDMILEQLDQAKGQGLTRDAEFDSNMELSYRDSGGQQPVFNEIDENGCFPDEVSYQGECRLR